MNVKLSLHRVHAFSGSAHSAGVGLVEVLVALIVIGVGMLGIASLYMTTLQAKTTAKSRTQAVNLADDLADRIRANRAATTSYALAQSTAPAAPTTNCVQTTASAAVQCSAPQLATQDLYLWNQRVNAVLPGNVQRWVTVAAGNPSTYTIFLSWTEPSSSAALSYTLVVQI